jgi:sulfur carrier protein
VPYQWWAEKKPSIPDADNAAEGKRTCSPFGAFLKFQHFNTGMQIKLNNQIKILAEPCTVQQLSEQFATENSGTKGIAIAVNQVVIPKSNWQQHLLHENDDVLVIKATQGG